MSLNSNLKVETACVVCGSSPGDGGSLDVVLQAPPSVALDRGSQEPGKVRDVENASKVNLHVESIATDASRQGTLQTTDDNLIYTEDVGAIIDSDVVTKIADYETWGRRHRERQERAGEVAGKHLSEKSARRSCQGLRGR